MKTLDVTALIDAPAATHLIQNITSTHIGNPVLRNQIVAMYRHWLKHGNQLPPIVHLPMWLAAAHTPACQAVTVSWHLVQIAAKLLDDLEDEPVERDAHPALTVNLATALLFVAQLALDIEDAGPETTWEMRRRLDSARLLACGGQHADLQSQIDKQAISPEEWLEIATAKSGALCGWAAWAGAVISGADPRTEEMVQTFGEHLGILLQLSDDYKDIWQTEIDGDLATGSPNLAICYALHVLSGSERAEFCADLERAQQGDLAVQAKLKQTLIACGAQAYMLVVARLQQKYANAAIASLVPPLKARLEQLVVATFPVLAVIV